MSVHRYPLPPNEAERLEALAHYDVGPPYSAESFDRITRLTARFFDVPVAFVTLIDAEQQRFTSCVGFEGQAAPREDAFCTHTILGDEVMVVEDAAQDPRFADNPFVTGPPYITFYAGAPLITPNGFRLGSLCAVDHVPRTFSPDERTQLRDLAAMVIDELELRREVLRRKRLEQDLREREQRFRNLVEQTNDWVWEIDAAGRFTYVNPRATHILGYPPDALIGQSTFDFMRAEEADRFAAVLGAYVEAQQPFEQLEKELIHRDGHAVMIETSGAPKFDDEGCFAGYRGVARDVTERVEAAQRMQAALEKEREVGRLKSRFVSMASHELRTPLATIQTSAELAELFGQRGDRAKARKHLGRIRQHIVKMTDLLEDVLVFGRTESHELPFAPESIDLAALVRELLTDVQQGIGQAHGWSVAGTEAPLPIEADPQLMQRVVGNLLTNAAKYAPAGSTVRVSVRATASTVTLEVADEGIGIAPEDQARLFEPFFRGDNVGTTSGTGLGLAILKEAVDLHDGSVEVQSTEGDGATFIVTLPRVAAHEEVVSS